MNCVKCGQEISDQATFCEHCGWNAQEGFLTKEPAERTLLGILGALVGAALGCGCIILLSRLGYMASISGIVLAFATLKGYELLGKKLSKKGIVISIVLMLLTPVIADWLDWGIVLMQEWEGTGVTYVQALLVFPMLLKEGDIVMSEYLSNLGMLYLFTAIGAIYTVRAQLKKK